MKPFWESKAVIAIAVLVVLAGAEPVVDAINTGDWRAILKAVGIAVVGGVAAWARSQAVGPLSIRKDIQ